MRPRQDEFDFLRETHEEMADALHLANRFKRDVQAEKDRPKADSAQHAYLTTMKELFATIRTEHQSWSQHDILKEAVRKYSAGIVCGDSAVLMALASHKLHRCPLQVALAIAGRTAIGPYGIRN